MEGGIAVGKTTTMERFVAADDVYLYAEHVNSEMLARFYRDNSYAFALQLLMFGARSGAASAARAPGTHVYDRGPLGDYAFALVQFARGAMAPAEWRIYTHLAGATPVDVYRALAAHADDTRIVYLRTPVDVAVARQRQRDEKPIDAVYMRAVVAVHELVMAALQRAGVPVYAFDERASTPDALFELEPAPPIDVAAARALLSERERAVVDAVLGLD